MNSNFMRFNSYEHFTEVFSDIFSLKYLGHDTSCGSSTTPICCWNFWVLGFALHLRKAKIISEALLHFSRKPHSVAYLKSKFYSFKHCFKNKLSICLFPTSTTWVPLVTIVSPPLFTCFPHHAPIPQPVSFSLGLQKDFLFLHAIE